MIKRTRLVQLKFLQENSNNPLRDDSDISSDRDLGVDEFVFDPRGGTLAALEAPPGLGSFVRSEVGSAVLNFLH